MHTHTIHEHTEYKKTIQTQHCSCFFKAIGTHNAKTHNPHNTPFKPQHKKNEQPTIFKIQHNTKRHTIQKNITKPRTHNTANNTVPNKHTLQHHNAQNTLQHNAMQDNHTTKTED